MPLNAFIPLKSLVFFMLKPGFYLIEQHNVAYNYKLEETQSMVDIFL